MAGALKGSSRVTGRRLWIGGSEGKARKGKKAFFPGAKNTLDIGGIGKKAGGEIVKKLFQKVPRNKRKATFQIEFLRKTDPGEGLNDRERIHVCVTWTYRLSRCPNSIPPRPFATETGIS